MKRLLPFYFLVLYVGTYWSCSFLGQKVDLNSLKIRFESERERVSGLVRKKKWFDRSAKEQ